jgi:DnaJ-class molecular chaperone
MNHYKILGVSNTATVAEIRRAYLRIAKETHPDTHPDDPKAAATFVAATTAYETLTDPQKRRQYDWESRPIASLVHLFHRKAGLSLLEAMLPTGPSVPRKGLDAVTTVQVPSEVLELGGVVEIPHPHNQEMVLSILLISGFTWCRFAGLGNPGQRGGANGDLYVHFSPTPNNA